jgi:S-(hydroxymethyl)glutathione dehydrogenase / alcohol dehydrogenase
MRAAVLHEHRRPFAIEEVELAPPGPGEVEVRLHASGVCRSDWSTVTGDTPSPLPAVLGHEGAGVVERVGAGVDSVEPGDHVVLSWLPYCGRCRHCTSGRPTLCDVAAPALLAGTLLDGTTRLSLDGRPVHHYSFLSTFAERTVVPEASCVRIRRDAPLRVAALVGCAIATGVGAVVNRARLAPGCSLAVFGAGGVGLSAVQAGVLSGAATIVAVDPAPARRALALELGAAHAVDPGAGDPAEDVRELTGGRGVDCAVESSGAPGAAAAAFGSVRRGGTLVCVGLPPAGTSVAFPGPELVRDEKTVMGCLYGSCRPHTDMPMLIDLHMAGRLRLDRLMGAVHPLDEIDRAFADMLDGAGARTLIDLT